LLEPQFGSNPLHPAAVQVQKAGMSRTERPEEHETESRQPAPSPRVGEAAEPDRAIIERAASGDVAAFETLYRLSSGRIHALCLRLAGRDRARAQDFLQEVYLRAWERLGSFESRSRFSTWLHRVAVNRITDLMRAEIRRSLIQNIGDGEIEVAARDGDRDAALDLEDGIRSLPDGARIVFVLHDVEGYGHPEIATMTGISIGTSKSQLHRARQLLRGRLSK
jgi:RNA polymerase sigma-70 factor (ECF subfamily)